MKGLLKKISNRTWKPAVQYYLRKEVSYKYDNLQLRIMPGVFHPGFFFSTKQLASFLKYNDIRGSKMLEVGSGSGLLSLVGVNNGAVVTAIDISHDAVECTKKNAEANKKSVRVLQSDLFSALGNEQFDLIIVNPPYYPADPENEHEMAWYAGKNMDYFRRFFSEARPYLSPGGKIWMVLSSECNLNAVLLIASEHNMHYGCLEIKRGYWEKGFIYQFTKNVAN